MKFRKSNNATGSGRMELVSSNPGISRNFKRSRSFRASARFMSKMRQQTTNIRDESDASKNSSRNLDIFTKNNMTNLSAKNVEFVSKLYTHTETKEITDLRGIVKDVKNKLSITMRTRRKKYNRECSSSAIDEVSSAMTARNKMASQLKNSTKKRHERAKNNHWNSMSELHSYENPTFDCSLDTSVADCLYENDPVGFDCENIENEKDSRETQDCEKIVTIIVGNDRRKAELKNVESATAPIPEVAAERSINDENRALISRGRFYTDNEIYEDKYTKNTSNSSSWLIGRGSSFRFKTAGGCSTGSTGFLTSGATSVSKFHALQGMEFLEGFGKKKQQQASNNLPLNINPLTAQPSLNIHVHALFSAVEHGHLDKARTILESTDVDVNSVNSDGLSALDVAVLGSNRSLAKMLVAFGAQEGNRFTSPECLGGHLASLLVTAEQRVQELGGTTSGNSIGDSTNCRNDFTSSHNGISRCADTTDEKQLALWERRVRTLRKMLLGFDQARPPDVPLLVAVDVIGTTSIVLKFQESEVHDSSICTKFKVQWSMSEDFTNVCGDRQVMDMKQRECRIDRLIQGERYHLRVAAGNIKGWSRFVPSTPAYVTPSSWRDLDGKEPRYFGRQDKLEELFASIRRPEYSNETPLMQRRNHKRKTTTIKQLFSATSKFQKSLRRGVYLACLLYNDDRILVTSEDFLPVIEIDETYSPSCIYNDFHWFMKVSCTWNDVKSLRTDMEKCQGNSSNHFRIKLLQASGQMQAALCLNDLGQIYHKPLRDVNGTMVISIVNNVKNPKSISLLNSRWLPLNKIMKKSLSHENNNNNNVADILMSSIQSQMTYHQLSSIKLTRGLYLGYLKMQSSVDLVQIFVPVKAPNVLPHCKIRDNPHVSAEEWEYLRRTARISSAETASPITEENKNAPSDANQGTEQEKLFVDLIATTSRRLFSYMNVNLEDSHNHRLYDAEVIELTNQVSLIVIVPPPVTACSAPGSHEDLLQRDDLLSLPIQVFEILHLTTYQKKLVNLYSRLSCILELDTAQAQHNHREAFSASEVSVAKERLGKLQELQSRINAVWKDSRWLIDLITFARDRGNSAGQPSSQNAGISMKRLLSIERNKNSSNNNNNNNNNNGHSLKRSLLQLPPRDPKLVKSSPGRGSWPGPNLSSSQSSVSNLRTTELSKSEQQLPNGGANGHYTRKNSVETTNYSHELASSSGSLKYNDNDLDGRFTVAKSDDSLLLTNYKHSPRNRLVNSLTLVSGNTSPVSLNGKTTFAYGRSFSSGGNSTSSNPNGPSNASSNGTDSGNSLNGSEDYNFVNTNVSHGKSKSSTKATASVAVVATPSADSQLDHKKDEATVMPAPLPGILQVYAAYETGLASGTSLKLHVTPRTTAREVVDLVVKQLNMAVVLKGQEGPIYTSDELPNFCLVAVIGARERCLRDDFKPLQLQNPWKKGRLYVRQKQDVLAALEHSSKHTAYL